MTVRPEDLATAMTCEMCSTEFPLGYALKVAKPKSCSWRFRLPPGINEDRILEATALAATAAAVQPDDHPFRASPHQFGVRLATSREGGRRATEFCEIDVVMTLDDEGRSEVVVGEVKNHKPFERDDVEHLRTVQRWFVECGVPCSLLFATLCEALSDAEVSLLREACEAAPLPHETSLRPLLPIVLVASDLSAPRLTPEHPRWLRPGDEGWETFSFGSCKRNLGLLDIEWPGVPEPGSWRCRWR
jgi:hypothetical protein